MRAHSGQDARDTLPDLQAGAFARWQTLDDTDEVVAGDEPPHGLQQIVTPDSHHVGHPHRGMSDADEGAAAAPTSWHPFSDHRRVSQPEPLHPRHITVERRIT